MNNHMIKNNSMIKTINQKNTLLNKDFKIRFKNHKMIKQTLKLRILLYNNQIPKEEKKEEIEGGKSSKKIKEITKIMMNLILMEILKIKEIKIRIKIIKESRINNTNKKAIVIKMMNSSNKEMKKGKCLIMNKKFSIKTNFRQMKIKSKKAKELIKDRNQRCQGQQVPQLEGVLTLKMRKGKELKKFK